MRPMLGLGCGASAHRIHGHGWSTPALRSRRGRDMRTHSWGHTLWYVSCASMEDDGDGLETPYPMNADAGPERASVRRLNLEAFIVDLLLLCTSIREPKPVSRTSEAKHALHDPPSRDCAQMVLSSHYRVQASRGSRWGAGNVCSYIGTHKVQTGIVDQIRWKVDNRTDMKTLSGPLACRNVLLTDSHAALGKCLR
jgi:hypothetical protein